MKEKKRYKVLLFGEVRARDMNLADAIILIRSLCEEYCHDEKYYHEKIEITLMDNDIPENGGTV